MAAEKIVSYQAIQLALIECNIDDMNPEFYPSVLERLFESGARDAWISPIVMKHGRPGSLFSVLCEPDLVESLCSVLFAETTTLGMRVSSVQRVELERQLIAVTTPYGEVRIKTASDASGRIANALPEFADCQALARQRSIPVKEVYQAAIESYRSSQKKE